MAARIASSFRQGGMFMRGRRYGSRSLVETILHFPKNQAISKHPKQIAAYGSAQPVRLLATNRVGSPPSNSNAFCWTGVGRMCSGNACSGASGGTTSFRVSVAKSASSVCKLCIGSPSGVRNLAASACVLSDTCAFSTGDPWGKEVEIMSSAFSTTQSRWHPLGHRASGRRRTDLAPESRKASLIR